MGATIMDDEDLRKRFEDEPKEEPASLGELVAPGQKWGEMTTVDTVVTAQKVAVARKHSYILDQLKMLAASAGERWYYSFPTKNKDGTKGVIEGPSVKCTNNVARLYGNNVHDTRLMSETPQTWTYLSRFVDLETGYSYTRPFQQRKDQKTLGTKDPGRALDIAFQIGASKASRNCIVNALEFYCDYAFKEAKRSLVEAVGLHLEKYRGRVLDRLIEMKVEVKRVIKVLGKDPKDWLAADVARLIAEIQAIGDGMAMPEDCWPPLEPTREGKQPEADKPKPETDKPKPETVKQTEPEGPTFTVFLDKEGKKTGWTGKDADKFTANILAIAAARRGNRDSLDQLWEDNSHQWDSMPDKGAALREAWAKFAEPEPDKAKKSTGFEVILPGDGEVIEVATEKEFLARLLEEAGKLTSLGFLNGMWESNEHQLVRVKPGNEKVLRAEWDKLKAKLSEAEKS